MDQELIAYLDQRFREVREEIASSREESSRRFEQVDESIRHTGVEVEGLRGQIQLLAEGMISFDQRLTGFSGEVRRDLESIRGLFLRLYEALQDRVRTLESWRETKERDPLEIIKERFGLQGPPQPV